jgi:hypothetical protein
MIHKVRCCVVSNQSPFCVNNMLVYCTAMISSQIRRKFVEIAAYPENPAPQKRNLPDSSCVEERGAVEDIQLHLHATTPLK